MGQLGNSTRRNLLGRFGENAPENFAPVHPTGSDCKTRSLRRALAVEERGPVLFRSEALGSTVKVLRRPEHQRPTRAQHRVKPTADAAPGRFIEVDQYVAAQDEVERTRARRAVQQVSAAKVDEAAQRINDLPVVELLLEVAAQVRGRTRATSRAL